MKVVYYEGINLLKPKWEKSKTGKFIFTFCKKETRNCIISRFCSGREEKQALAEFSVWHVHWFARAAPFGVRGVQSISARKNFRFTLVIALAASWLQKIRTFGFPLLRENVTEQSKQSYQVNVPLFVCFQEIQESIRNREPQLNLIRKQSGEFVSHGKQIMEPYKRLLDRRWDDLAARIGELEKELADAKRQAEQGRAMGGRVETEIIVKVRTRSFNVLLLCFCLKTNGIHWFLCVFFTQWPRALQPERVSTRSNARRSEISVEILRNASLQPVPARIISSFRIVKRLRQSFRQYANLRYYFTNTKTTQIL